MIRFTVNKDNWSGESCDVTLLGGGTFTIGMDNLTFQLQGWHKGCKSVTVICHQEPNWEWAGFVDGETRFSDCGVERSHINPFIAFAKLAWNVI